MTRAFCRLDCGVNLPAYCRKLNSLFFAKDPVHVVLAGLLLLFCFCFLVQFIYFTLLQKVSTLNPEPVSCVVRRFVIDLQVIPLLHYE